MLIRLLSSLFIGIICLNTLCEGSSSYVITSPRSWSSGSPAQVCISVAGDRGNDDYFNVTIKSRSKDDNIIRTHSFELPSSKDDVIIPTHSFKIPSNLTEFCETVNVPHLDQTDAHIVIDGKLGQETINHEASISVVSDVQETYISTDKFLYKPGQTVKFRALTIVGPFLQISTDSYASIWVQNPQGTRIAQWLHVENPGLIHLEFQLSDEPEEGTYYVQIQSKEGKRTSKNFKVEEFVLPRYEASITTPPYILGSDTEFNFTVCAKYTYGQPVKGKVNFTLDVSYHSWRFTDSSVNIVRNINGCEVFNVAEKKIIERITALATIIEEGTNTTIKAESKSKNIKRTALTFKNIGQEAYYKTGLPFTGMVKVTFPDGSPAANESMKVCSWTSCKLKTTDYNGIVRFVSPPHLRNSIVISSVKYDKIPGPRSTRQNVMQRSVTTIRIEQYFSPSNSSLIVSPLFDKMKCKSGQIIEFDLPVMFVLSNETKARLNVMVISRGQVQFMKASDYNLESGPLSIDESNLIAPLLENHQSSVKIGTIQMRVSVRNAVSPKAKILAWIVRDDGEVVSDYKEVTFKRCLNNDVSLSWSKDKPQPGESASLKLKAEPKSLCSVGVVDKSVELLSSENEPLSVKEIFKIVEKAEVKEWQNRQVDDHEYCRKKILGHRSVPLAPEPMIDEQPILGEPLSGNQPVVFQVVGDEGTVVMKRSSYWRPSEYSTHYVDAMEMFDKSGLNVFTNQIIETRPCEDIPSSTFSDAYGGSGVASGGHYPGQSAAAFGIAPVLLSYEDNKLNTENAERTYFPETWLWQLNVINDSGEDLQNLTMPDTITEWVGRAVCVHPTKGVGLSGTASVTTFTPFFVDLTIPPSVKRGEILPVVISTFNYLDHDLPVKIVLVPSDEYDILEGSTADAAVDQVAAGSRGSCITAQGKNVHTIRIKAKVTGDVNLTIDAFVDRNSTCTNITDQPFINKRDVIIKPIKVEAEGFPREETWTKYICTKDIQQNLDSLEGWKIILPNVLVDDSARGWLTASGDLMGPTIDNLGHLVRLPTGCGEQNMLNFAPNIFVLQYLDASNQTTENIASTAVNYMKTGYQRELNYRHNDGSYSAFGNSDSSGSTWLTAFVVKSFAQASQYINIDKDDLSMSKDWLKGHQLENGCFESIGKVLHQGMKGGASGSDSPVILTAYVLISLMEAGELPSSRSVADGLYCLRADKSNNTYTLALKAYALALTKQPEAEGAIAELLAESITNTNSIHWDPSGNKGGKDPASVEIAGYAVLAMTTFKQDQYKEDVIKIVKWMSTQMNGQGGFVSTQDTVVALQALANFEGSQPQGPLNLKVLVESANLKHIFNINEKNKLLQQLVMLPELPTNVILELNGDGCALVQAVLRYNVPEASPSETFDLNVTTSTAADDSCKTKTIKVCASYKPKSEVSNMAVIEVNIPSGYIPDKQTLKQLVGYGTFIFKRYEVDGNQVNLYIDEFSNNVICGEFNILRTVLIENVKPSTVKVYDYYKPQFTVDKKYTLPAPDECNRIFKIDDETIPIDYYDYGIV